MQQQLDELRSEHHAYVRQSELRFLELVTGQKVLQDQVDKWDKNHLPHIQDYMTQINSHMLVHTTNLKWIKWILLTFLLPLLPSILDAFIKIIKKLF